MLTTAEPPISPAFPALSDVIFKNKAFFPSYFLRVLLFCQIVEVFEGWTFPSMLLERMLWRFWTSGSQPVDLDLFGGCISDIYLHYDFRIANFTVN